MKRLDYIPGTDRVLVQRKDFFSFGIDAILLSAYAEMKKGSTLIDLCTGNGIVALRCQALYSLAQVWGIEIQSSVIELAHASAIENNLEQVVHFIHADLNEIDRMPERVDYITVNPPYVEVGRGLENQSDNDRISRTESRMVLEDVFRFARSWLKPKGKLYMIHRPNRLVDIMEFGRKYTLEPKRMRFVHSSADEAPVMVLLEMVYSGGKNFVSEAPLVIYQDDGQYTREVKEIYYGRG